MTPHNIVDITGEEAITIVLARIKSVVFSDAFGGVFDCATCGAMVHGLDDGDWLECIVGSAFEHKCK